MGQFTPNIPIQIHATASSSLQHTRLPIKISSFFYFYVAETKIMCYNSNMPLSVNVFPLVRCYFAIGGNTMVSQAESSTKRNESDELFFFGKSITAAGFCNP